MKRSEHGVLLGATRLYAPIVILFAFSLLVARAPGAGVGFVAGLGFVLVLLLHALVFGAATARGAVPPVVARIVTSAGLVGAVWGAVANAAWAAQAIEGGLFAATVGAGALIVTGLFGRAPGLSDEEW